MTKPMLTIPTVHIGGTDGGSLADGYLTARLKVIDALDAIRLTAPHGRDYIGPDAGALSKATAEHWARIAVLETLAGDLECLSLGVVDQIEARVKAKTSPRTPKVEDVCVMGNGVHSRVSEVLGRTLAEGPGACTVSGDFAVRLFGGKDAGRRIYFVSEAGDYWAAGGEDFDGKYAAYLARRLR